MYRLQREQEAEDRQRRFVLEQDEKKWQQEQLIREAAQAEEHQLRLQVLDAEKTAWQAEMAELVARLEVVETLNTTA